MIDEIPDDELIRRVLRWLRPHGRSLPLWSLVMDTFMLGSNYSQQLCRRFGFDPDEER